jgi:NAD(P)-dependent dehydrogenase (short-subunit alcohol dehydrogenase family)
MISHVAVVTGGTKGIGLGIAETLAGRQASVAITYHSDDDAAESAAKRLTDLAGAPGKILVLKGNVGDESTTAAPAAVGLLTFAPFGRTLQTSVAKPFGRLNPQTGRNDTCDQRLPIHPDRSGVCSGQNHP